MFLFLTSIGSEWYYFIDDVVLKNTLKGNDNEKCGFICGGNMNRVIVWDSSVNLKALDCSVPYRAVPLKIIAGEREFVDDETLDVSEMVAYLDGYKGKSSTACPGIGDWLAAFGDADEVFCFTITSGLSGSYNAARIAKETYETEHPQKRVFICDSLSAGPEITILIEKAVEMIRENKDFESISKRIKAYQKHTALLFSLESLRNLMNNGRVSPLVGRLAGALGIRIVGRASVDGVLEPLDKCRGEKKALLKIWTRMKEMGYQGGKVRIDHCFNPAAAQTLKQMILMECSRADIVICETVGLCSFYAEKGGLIVGFEK